MSSLFPVLTLGYWLFLLPKNTRGLGAKGLCYLGAGVGGQRRKAFRIPGEVL